MGKKKTDALPYDGEKLRQQIESHNYTLCGLSDDLGYSRTYLGNMVNHSNGMTDIPRRVVMLLETVGIHYKDYEPDPEPIIPKEVEIPIVPWEATVNTVTVRLDEEQMAQLAVMIREQVYEAMARIWGVEK